MTEKFKKRKGTDNLKGPQYEYRLVLHFMLKAILNDYHSFQLASNIEAAGEFDDVVFCYRKNESDPEKIRFVQAKNRNLNKVIKLGDFNFTGYFESYTRIKSEADFTGKEIQDMIYLTPQNISQKEGKIEFSNTTRYLESIVNDNEDVLLFPHAEIYKLMPLYNSATPIPDYSTIKLNSKQQEKSKKIDTDSLQKFLDYLTFAVGVPDESALGDLIKENVQLLLPFAEKQKIGDIYSLSKFCGLNDGK